jgi:hypothetical protein
MDNYERAFWLSAGWDAAMAGVPREAVSFLSARSIVHERRVWLQGWDAATLQKSNDYARIDQELEKEKTMEMALDENNEQWGIVELMGRKVVAGRLSKSEMLGVSLMRVDVPATKGYPAYTAFYSDKALYGVTFVSEEVAKRTAEEVSVNPVSVYVPDLITRDAYDEIKTRWEQAQEEIYRLKRLPAGESSRPDPGSDDELKAPFEDCVGVDTAHQEDQTVVEEVEMPEPDRNDFIQTTKEEARDDSEGEDEG